MIPTTLAAPAYFGPKSTLTTTPGIPARTAKAASPMAVTSPSVSVRVLPTLMPVRPAETSRGKATVTSAPGRNRAIWPAIAAAA